MARDGQKTLNNILDQYVNNLGVNAATSYIDAGHVGGTSGSNISLSVTNIDRMATAFDLKLNELDIPAANRFQMYGPRSKAILNRYIGGKETAMGDVIGQNGQMPNRFGFETYYSNNNYFTATFTCGAAMTSGTDSLLINGATLEVVTTIDSDETATSIGFLYSSNTTTQILNLSYAINDTGGTEGTEWSTNDASNRKARRKLVSCGAIATVSTNVLSLVAYGDIVVGTGTMTSGSNLWSAQTSYILAGLKKSISIATQVSPEISIRPVDNKLGNNIFVWNLYGGKVFADMADALVYAKIDASTWT